MCGIAGILNLDGQPCDPEAVRLITDALAHRGPDGSGIHVDGPLGLGHRRLAILDLTAAGKQPMAGLDGRYWITFNGEFYNFVELARELEAEGHHFVSHSDTEVILAAYHRWGADCLFKFNGMWAFAIWDSHRRELFLSVDRFGIKPLHYVSEPRRFVFASEIKAFLRLKGFSPRENATEMRLALGALSESAEATLLQGVSRLPAGHNMMVSTAGLRIWRWWRTLDHVQTVPKRFPEQVEQFRELFFDSCRLRLRSDVPVATCLSGGLDSSSIICSLAAMQNATPGSTDRLTDDYHRAFVATYPGSLWDEREYAEAAIRQAHATPRIREVKVDGVVEDLEQFAYDFEIVGAALLFPLWYIYRELRRDGVVVSLDGHGGDELLGGYQQSIKETLQAEGSLLRAPYRTTDLVRTLSGIYSSGTYAQGGFWNLLANSDPFLRGSIRTARRVVSFATRPFRRMTGPSPAPAAEAAWSGPSPRSPWVIDGEEAEAMMALSPMNLSLYRQFHHGILPSILHKFDRCSMAHGVEIRMPFMDWRLVCYAFGLPDKSKIGGGFTKRVLRESMRGVLPEVIRRRKGKIGFISPLPDWFRGSLGDWIWAQVRTPSFLGSDLWNGPAIRDFVAARHAAKEWSLRDCNRVWRFMQAHLWRRSFGLA